MSKYSEARLLLAMPLPTELLAKIATYSSNWYGASEKDAHGVIRFWQDYKARRLYDSDWEIN